MRIIKLFIGVIISFTAVATNPAFAQGGDQILDGIGETDLVARYTFRRDIRDWSRNNLHGKLQGSDFKFVNDELFGNVLSLPGKNESYITIPAEWLNGQESISITGWIFLHSAKSGQVFFDFGKDKSSHFFVAPTGTGINKSFEAHLVNKSGNYVVSSPIIEANKWNHVTVVINFPSNSLSTYINGKFTKTVKNADMGMEKMFDNKSKKDNKFFIGKSMDAGNQSLDARLHDFRIYRTPLTEDQITGIYMNAFKRQERVTQIRRQPAQDLQEFPESTPQLYNAYLISVPEVKVETVVGNLPRLPRYIPGVYSNNIEGPDVRVLWPAPTDNSQVLSPGTYSITGIVPGTDIQAKAEVTIKGAANIDTPDRKLEGFSLDQVLLNNDPYGNKTKFIENRDKFLRVLSGVNPDNFLYMFRNAFGQAQPEGVKALRGWDSQETKLRGHATGHYMSAIAQAYASTCYDKSLQAIFSSRMEYMVNTLYDLSQLSGKPQKPGGDYVSDPIAVPFGPGKQGFDSDLSVEGIRTDYWNWGKGFISAYPPDQFIMLEKGASYGGDNSKIWAPYYTLHKILAGLLDIYEYSGNEKALEIVKGMGDWVYARLSQVPSDTLISMWNTYIAGEFGGMNEAMARLYRLTNEPRYLATAQLFDNIKVFFGDAEHSHGLAKNVDLFRSLHANQHIPQIMGALEIYRVSDKPEYYSIADNFWNKTTDDYMYCIGGVAGARRNPNNGECFTCQPATLYENGFSAGGQNETCATYNMLKLTRNLFFFNQRPELMDYYERGLYNHILASVAEDTPANTYHVPLRAGSVKRFDNANMDGFSCCNGTALESSTKLQNSIYFKSTDNKALYVNLYVPSTLKWTEKNVTITQLTAFPKEDFTRLTIKGNAQFELNVRVPHWATKGFFVKINGKNKKIKAVPGNYLTLNRKWKDGDTIELRMPFQFHLEPVMDQQNIASLFYGPVLLAAQESEPLTDWRKITLNPDDLGKSISGDPEQLQFNIDGVVFKPFYETYGRYSVYLNVSLKKD